MGQRSASLNVTVARAGSSLLAPESAWLDQDVLAFPSEEADVHTSCRRKSGEGGVGEIS